MLSVALPQPGVLPPRWYACCPGPALAQRPPVPLLLLWLPADDGRDCTYYTVVDGERPVAADRSLVLLDSYEPPLDFVISEWPVALVVCRQSCQLGAACGLGLWSCWLSLHGGALRQPSHPQLIGGLPNLCALASHPADACSPLCLCFALCRSGALPWCDATPQAGTSLSCEQLHVCPRRRREPHSQR